MRFRPLGGKSGKRPRERPVGIVAAGVGGLHVWSDAGAEIGQGPRESRNVLARYRDHVLYTVSGFTPIRMATGPEGWKLFRWGAARTVVWQELDGVRIIGSRGVFDGVHPGEAIETMLRIHATAREYGVRMGSWSSMAQQLWRSTLTHPIAFAGRQLGRNGMYGGRKQTLRWVRGVELENVAHVDLKGAYPHAMWREPYPTRMVLGSRPTLAGEGVTRARVRMPSMPWAAIPERVHPQVIRWDAGREIEGWWANRELRAAVDAGAVVEPIQTWEGTRFVEPFAEWGSIIHMLRERPGPEGSWWKGISNALWGTFSMANVGGEILTLGPDGEPVDRKTATAKRPPPPTAAYIATLTGARVRVRVFGDALGFGFSESTVYVDTDGVLILDGGELPPGATDHPLPGEWSVDRIMPRVLIKGPQAWGWWDDEDRPHVSIAGLPHATVDVLRRTPISDVMVSRGGARVGA